MTASIASILWLILCLVLSVRVTNGFATIENARISAPSKVCQAAGLQLHGDHCTFNAKLQWSWMDAAARLTPTVSPTANAISLSAQQTRELSYGYDPADFHAPGGYYGTMLITLAFVALGILPSVPFLIRFTKRYRPYFRN